MDGYLEGECVCKCECVRGEKKKGGGGGHRQIGVERGGEKGIREDLNKKPKKKKRCLQIKSQQRKRFITKT